MNKVISEDWRVTSNDPFFFQEDGKKGIETTDQKTSIPVIISSSIGNLELGEVLINKQINKTKNY